MYRQNLVRALSGLMAGVGVLAAAWMTPAAADDQVQVLATGPTSLRFAVSIPTPTLEPMPGDPGRRVIGIPGFEIIGTPDAAGLPARTVQVAVPAQGTVRVRGVSSGGQEFSELRLAPAPSYERDGDELVPRYGRGEAADRPRSAAVSAARVLSVSWLRGQRVATLSIEPADYDPQARRLRVAARVEVEVEFGADAAGNALATVAEPDDPFESVYRSTLVNYEQGRRWRRTRADGVVAFAAGGGARALSLIPQDTLFAGRSWAKLAIPASGFYKVNYGQLRNLAAFAGLDTVRLGQLRMVAWRGFPYQRETEYCDTCGYREVAIEFVSPDLFSGSNANEVYFYALGANDWQDVFDPALDDSEFVNHPYESRNYYFLTATTPGDGFPGTPRRIAAIDPGVLDLDGSETVPTTFEMRVHREQDLVPYPNLSPKATSQTFTMFWEKFFWASQQLNRDFPPDTISTPGVENALPASIRVRLWGITAADTCFTPVYYGNHLVDVTVNGVALPREGWNGNIGFTYRADVTLNPFNNVNMRIPGIPPCPTRDDQQALAWYQLRYARRFEPVGDELAFDSPATGGHYAYRVGPFANTTPPRLFDVTDPFEPTEIVVTASMYQDSASQRWLRFETNESGRRRYCIIQNSSIALLANLAVTAASPVSLSALRDPSKRADYIVIYYDPFKQAADELSSWRSTHLPLDGGSGNYTALALPISAVYDQFSGGRTDPGAIRSFLRAAFYNWAQPPAFVTLLGDASYDYKNVLKRAPLGQAASPVPSYENGYSLGTAFASDDWVLNVNDPFINVPDFFGGRIPVNTASEALDFVRRKVVAYEQTAPLGAWRNRLMLIADDDKQGAKPDGLHWKHLSQTSDVDSTDIPEHIDREYVYLHKYPDGPGNTKPDAKAELKQNVNDGLLLFNYIGHGSPFKLADETVLLDVDAGTFENANQLAIFVAASCDVGKFSNPQVQSLGERMLLASNGGAVAVVSATELALSDFNANLVDKFFQSIYVRGAVSGQYCNGISQALLTAKNATVGQVDNNSKYAVMGDAAAPFNLPRRWAEVNLYACDTCTTPLTELKAGQLAVYRGKVLESPGGPPVPMTGVADLLIEDSAPRELSPRCSFDTVQNYCDPLITRSNYYYRAGSMYRGDARISNGTFSGAFVVPAEAVRGARGRLRAYVQGTVGGELLASDGVGSIRAQVSNGEATPGDSTGPSITLSFDGGATSVRSDATLRIDLYDPSGILTTGHSPQNGIIVTLDGNSTARLDITPSFRYLAGSYQSGAASFQLPGIAAGPHTISVSAADNLAAGLTAGNHRSSSTLAFEVADVPPLTISYAYLFPNPTTSGGTGSGGSFVVDARGDSLNALLRIYTMSGKMVRSLTRFGGIGQVQLNWDGLDAEGDKLANGVYFFRVQVNVRDEMGKSSPRQSASAEGRFVIVNH